MNGRDREIENQVSVNRLSQALSSYADHRCNAVSKVYTSTTVTLSLCHASQSHGLPAERGREGRARDGPAMCTGQRRTIVDLYKPCCLCLSPCLSATRATAQI